MRRVDPSIYPKVPTASRSHPSQSIRGLLPLPPVKHRLARKQDIVAESYEQPFGHGEEMAREEVSMQLIKIMFLSIFILILRKSTHLIFMRDCIQIHG